jgi:hypothetical protein
MSVQAIHIHDPWAFWVSKNIWFWEVDVYLRDGWCVGRECFGASPRYWPKAIFEIVRPVASRLHHPDA